MADSLDDLGSGCGEVPCAEGRSCRLGTRLDRENCAHRCITCMNPIHLLCGKAVEGEEEGFGSRRLCSDCHSKTREQATGSVLRIPPSPSDAAGPAAGVVVAIDEAIARPQPVPVTSTGSIPVPSPAQQTQVVISDVVDTGSAGPQNLQCDGAIRRLSVSQPGDAEARDGKEAILDLGDIEKESAGVFLETSGVAVYTAAPRNPDLVLLQPGTLAIASKRGSFLDKLVMAHQTSVGQAQKYVIDCRIPSKQLYVKCSRAGLARSRKQQQTVGSTSVNENTEANPAPRATRKRESKKTSCQAKVYWRGRNITDLKFAKSETDKLSVAFEAARKSDKECCVWEVVSVSLCHNHEVLRMNSATEFTYDSRNEEVIGVLQQFLSMVRGKRSRGLVYNAKRYLEEQLPGRIFAESVVRNSLQHIQNVCDEAQKLILRLASMKENGDVEYYSYCLAPSGVLEYVSWAPKGAKELVTKYGKDTCSTDATHKVSKFTLKLWGVLLLDADQHSRPVFLSLILNENVSTFKRLLEDYMRCFEVRLPSVVFSDNDFNFASALSTVPEPSAHLLCLWHLVDQSLKQHVASSLCGGASSFAVFRKDLMLVRDVAETSVAERLWSELLTAYFPDPVKQRRALDYMKLMYSWRFKWWICHNLNAPTLGMLSTQRSEGWHALLKAVTSVYMPLETFVAEICRLVSEIDEKAERRALCRRAVSESSFVYAVLGKQSVDYLNEMAVSAKACEILNEEAQASLPISVYGGSNSYSPDGNEFRIQTCYSDYVVLKTGAGRSESDLMRHYSRPVVTLRGNQNGIECACSCNFKLESFLSVWDCLADIR